MKYEAPNRRTLLARIAINGSGEIVLQAENLRYERTGAHAKVSIYHNGTCLDYDVFNIDRSEERRRLTVSAHKLLSTKAQSAYPGVLLKADMDRFCFGLEIEWQRRIPLNTIVTGETEEKPTPPPYILYPLLLKDQPNFVFGERSTAKSLTAALITGILYTPWKDNPLKVHTCESPIMALYCDWEWGFEDLKFHLERIARGHDLQVPLGLYHQPIIGPLYRNIPLVQRLRAETKAELIIYDSATMACGVTDLNKTEGPIEMYEAIREIGGTAFILGHTSKNQDDPRKTVYGNQVFESQARNIWECLKAEPNEHCIDVGLFHRKSPPFTHKSKPLGYHADFDDGEGTTILTWKDPRKVPEFSNKLTAADRITQSLSKGMKTTKQLMEELSLKRETLDSALSRLKDKGAIAKLGEQWCLPSDYGDSHGN